MSKHTPKTNSNQSSAMAQLLAKHQNKFVTLKKGESIKAKITKLTTSEIIVDAGSKTEAIVLEKDKRIVHTIMNQFKVGDTVEVNVLNPESENGHPIVSLRRYLGNMAWEKLEELQKKSEQLEIVIKDSSKAGYVVDTEFGISGFLPQSHVAFTQDALTPGQTVKARVLELNRTDNKVIFSQKQLLSEEEFAALTKKYKVGEKLKVIIATVTPFGLYVGLPNSKDAKDGNELEGFIHISETSWDKVTDLNEMFSPGQEIEAALIRFDSETRRVSLSIKRLTADPFETLIEKYPVDTRVKGTVTEIADGDVIFSFGEGAEGVLRKDKIAPGTTYEQGQVVNLTIADHDKRKHRILVTPVLLEKPMGYR
ncbi:MAG TPA: S1 RNA-binding domain-containing protein [Candidatus Saccharimonadales bacterium]|nr:S1 RNA-binding domain-containing protein [Candidatus Saccharimonadales bacterium]